MEKLGYCASNETEKFLVNSLELAFLLPATWPKRSSVRGTPLML